MKMQVGIFGDAHPRGQSKYRHWLSRSWGDGPTALVIGINPNTATESDDDGMTNFLTTLLRGLDGKYKCGGYLLVNCCDQRHPKPEQLKTLPAPCSPSNKGTVQRMIAKCAFIVASWGTTHYGECVAVARREIVALVQQSGKGVICFSPLGLPIYCSRTNCNSRDGRWSKTPVPWADDS
jgi:hypothetical protein